MMDDSPRTMRYEGRDMSYAVRSSAALTVALLGFGLPSISQADVTHTVARGHTVEAIAHRYRVSVKSILDANHLKDPRHLKIGDTLTIPGATEKDAGKDGKKGKKDAKTPIYAMRAKTPGVVHVARLATSEDFTVRVSDRRGKQSPVAQKAFEKMMRAGGGQTHPIDPRLIALVGLVSNHFGSRKLEIVSGFRPYTPTQYTAHSNHNVGRAIDFRVAGVPNEVLRDFCRTLKNVGVGYYPNSTFVHLDVREMSAFWIDYARPGEPPRYNANTVDADEGTSDVSDDSPATSGSEAPSTISGASPTSAAAPAPSPTPTAATAPPSAPSRPNPAPNASTTPAPQAAPISPPTPAPSAPARGDGSGSTSSQKSP